MMKLLEGKCGLLEDPTGTVTRSLTVPGSVTSRPLRDTEKNPLIDLYLSYFWPPTEKKTHFPFHIHSLHIYLFFIWSSVSCVAAQKVLGSVPGRGVEFACSPHVCVGFPLGPLVSPTIKNMYFRVNTQLVPSNKCNEEALDLFPGCRTMAAFCSSEENGSNAENKFHCTGCAYVRNKVYFLHYIINLS